MSDRAKTTVSLRTPGRLAFRGLAVNVVAEACVLSRQARGSSDTGFDHAVISAFSEAFNNIVDHAYGRSRGDATRGAIDDAGAVGGRAGETAGEILVEVDFDATRFRIRLLDFGESFDPVTVLAPRLELMPESGMGLFIIRNSMDEVDYRDGVPNVLTLTKRLRAESAPSLTGVE